MSEQTARHIIVAGAILFLLGLITGFILPGFENPRMGLASHLEGVMNGTFLIAVGAIWSRLALSLALQSSAFWLLIYGTYANWFFVSLAAIFGTSKMTPIAGAGHDGLPWQETLVTAGLSTVGIAMLAGCVILIFGLVRKRHDAGND